MTLDERHALTKEFFEKCQDLLIKKGADYSPDGQAFGDLMKVADEIETSSIKTLWVYARKQISAVTSYVKKGRLESESIDSRLIDTANFMALLYVLIILLKKERNSFARL